MSANCTVKNIEELKKADNKVLVKEIQNYTSDEASQLTLFNVTALKDFTGTPNLLGVRKYLEVDNLKSVSRLTDMEKTQILNMFVGKSWSTEEFLNAFSENGVFEINAEKLSKYLSIEEINNVLKKEEQFKTIYYKIKRYFPEEASPIEAPFTNKNSFFADEVQNPDIIEDMVKTTYAGIETVDDIQEKNEPFGTNNPGLVEKYMRGKKLLGAPIVRDLDVNGKPEYYDNLRTKLYYLLSPDTDLSFIKETVENISENSLNEISDFFKEELGIDLNVKNLEGTEEDLRTFFKNLYDLSTSENRYQVVDELYKSYLKLSLKGGTGFIKKHSMPDIEGAVVINSKSEQEVFDKNSSILKQYPNVYVRVNPKSVSWAVYHIFENEKSFVEDRSIFEGVPNIPYNEKNRGEIELQIEANILKAATKYGISPELAANKFLYQLPFEEKIEIYPGTVNVPNFVTNLFKELPSNGKNIFSLRRNGTLYMRGQGEYSKKLLQLNLSEQTYSDLVAYANISMEPSMAHLREKRDSPTKSDFRNFYAQNPKALKNTKESVGKIVGTAFIAPGATQDFFKINGEVYEKVNDKLGLYEKLPILSDNNFSLTEPTPSIPLSTVESIIENTMTVVPAPIIVNKPESVKSSTLVDMTRGVKSLKEFKEDYRKFFDKNVFIGYNNVFTFEEKNNLIQEINKINDEFVKTNKPVHYVVDKGFHHNRSNNTYELLGLRLAKGFAKKAEERVALANKSIPSQTIKEIEQQPFLTPEQIKDAYSAISDSDVTNWTEEDLDCS